MEEPLVLEIEFGRSDVPAKKEKKYENLDHENMNGRVCSITYTSGLDDRVDEKRSHSSGGGCAIIRKPGMVRHLISAWASAFSSSDKECFGFFLAGEESLTSQTSGALVLAYSRRSPNYTHQDCNV